MVRASWTSKILGHEKMECVCLAETDVRSVGDKDGVGVQVVEKDHHQGAHIMQKLYTVK